MFQWSPNDLSYVLQANAIIFVDLKRNSFLELDTYFSITKALLSNNLQCATTRDKMVICFYNFSSKFWMLYLDIGKQSLYSRYDVTAPLSLEW